MHFLRPKLLGLISTVFFLLPFWSRPAKGEDVLLVTSNQLVEARAKLISPLWEDKSAAMMWFTGRLKNSSQADAVAQFLFDSFPIIGTNAFSLLFGCLECKSPGLRAYAEKLYSEASARLSTNTVHDFEMAAFFYDHFDKTNAARRFARDLPRVPFFDYRADYLWSARDMGRGARGQIASSIGYSGDEESIRALVRLLDSPEVDFRRIAAYGLGHTDLARYLGLLQKRLKIETDSRVRHDLWGGIENCAYFSLRVRAEQLHSLGRSSVVSREAQQAKARQNEAVQAQIRQWLTNADEPTRVLAAYASSRVRVSSTAEYLGALQAADEQEQSARCQSILRECAERYAARNLDYLEGVKPGELRPHSSRLAELPAIESNPLVSPKLQQRARALDARAEAEVGK